MEKKAKAEFEVRREFEDLQIGEGETEQKRTPVEFIQDSLDFDRKCAVQRSSVRSSSGDDVEENGATSATAAEDRDSSGFSSGPPDEIRFNDHVVLRRAKQEDGTTAETQKAATSLRSKLNKMFEEYDIVLT